MSPLDIASLTHAVRRTGTSGECATRDSPAMARGSGQGRASWWWPLKTGDTLALSCVSSCGVRGIEGSEAAGGAVGEGRVKEGDAVARLSSVPRRCSDVVVARLSPVP